MVSIIISPNISYGTKVKHHLHKNTFCYASKPYNQSIRVTGII